MLITSTFGNCYDDSLHLEIIMRRTARSDHTTGGEWRWLFATHANPSRSAEAINLMSVPHLHFIYASVAGSTLGPRTDPKAQSLLGHVPSPVRITSDQCPTNRPHRFLPLSARPLRFKPARSQFGSPPNYMAGSGL